MLNCPHTTLKNSYGLSQEDFRHLHGKLAAYLDVQKALYPLTRRGRKDSKLALKDRLLLTFYYLRHYPTLINLAAVFGINESYCHKIYARTARILTKVEKLPNRKALLEACLSGCHTRKLETPTFVPNSRQNRRSISLLMLETAPVLHFLLEKGMCFCCVC